jgi:hypothetical protein
MLELNLFTPPYTLYVYTHFPFIHASIHWATADQKKQAVIIMTMMAVLLSDPPPASCLDSYTEALGLPTNFFFRTSIRAGEAEGLSGHRNAK